MLLLPEKQLESAKTTGDFERNQSFWPTSVQTTIKTRFTNKVHLCWVRPAQNSNPFSSNLKRNVQT